MNLSMQPHSAAQLPLPFNTRVRNLQAVPDPLSTVITDSPIMRVHIPPLEKRRLYRSILSRMPLRTAAYVVGTMIVNKDAGRAIAIE